jgi:hypothetical protein
MTPLFGFRRRFRHFSNPGGLTMKRLLLLPLALSGIAFSAHAANRTVTNRLGVAFVQIPAGSFTMSANKNSEDAFDNETRRTG